MLDVTSLGATGDGTTDDTAALQSALTVGGQVYVPGGVYLVTGPLRIRERTRLTLAPDARILRGGASGMLRNRWPDDNFPGYSGRGQILVEGGTWDMQGSGTGDLAVSASAFTFAHADDIKLRDMRIVDVPGFHGVDLVGCRNVRIDGVTFSGFRADPSDGQARESVQVDGAFAGYSGDCFPYDATPCEDVIVSQCRFEASAALPAPQRGVGSHGYLEIVQGHEHRHIRVTENTMVGLTDRAVVAWCWTESVIEGNTITDSGENGVAIRQGCQHVDVLHNAIYDSGTSGIWANGGVGNLVIRGNTIIGSGRSATNTHYGVCVEASCSVVDITDNRIRRRSTGNGAKYGLYISGSCTDVLHHSNDLRNSGVTGPRLDNSASPVTSAADAL